VPVEPQFAVNVAFWPVSTVTLATVQDRAGLTVTVAEPPDDAAGVPCEASVAVRV
jgi:hypothetical protein